MNIYRNDEYLDLEFRALLRQIKISIINVNSRFLLEYYTYWLEYLNNENTPSKRPRNQLLKELASQIENQDLRPPFTEKPYSKTLSIMNSKDIACQRVKSRSAKFKSLPRNAFASKISIEADDDTEPQLPPKRTQKKVPIKRRHRSCKPSVQSLFLSEQHRELSPLRATTSLEGPTGIALSAPYLTMVESAKTVDLVELKRLDSISWLDLSESNSTKSRSSTDLKDVVKTPDDLTPKEHVSPEEDRISLRGFLKDPNVIVTDLKKTIEGLQLRLTETIKQNNELKTQLSRRKDVSSDDSDRVIQKTDMELLKDMQDESTRKLEESFHGKLSLLEHNFQGQLDELKTTYETQIHRLSMDKEVGMKDKDQEISRLNDIIEKQCLRMSNEITSLRARMVESINANSNDDKIVFLQKCVAKMDRLFQKAERDYQKQIQKLKATLDQKEKSMQILLKSQRVEVMSKTCQEKQSQFDMVVNNLEVKYVKMLESQAQQYLEAKIKQDRMVEYLKQILDKHCIDYDLQNYD